MHAERAYETGEGDRLTNCSDVVTAAQRAKKAGATRFCMGVAWQNPKDRDLGPVCEMVS